MLRTGSPCRGTIGGDRPAAQELRREVEADVRLVPDLPVPDARQAVRSFRCSAAPPQARSAELRGIGEPRADRKAVVAHFGDPRCRRADEPGPEGVGDLPVEGVPPVRRVARIGRVEPAGRCSGATAAQRASPERPGRPRPSSARASPRRWARDGRRIAVTSGWACAPGTPDARDGERGCDEHSANRPHLPRR